MSLRNVPYVSLLLYPLVAFGVNLVTPLLSETCACDTPVYRYAMYRWEPAPYEIYYFHQDAIAAEAAQLHQRIEAVARSEQNPANVMLLPVSLKDDPELKRVPPDVKKAWLAQEKPAIPAYMITTPLGVQLHLGALDEATLNALIDSPVRGQIAQQLEEGKAAVLLLVTAGDAAVNAEAEKVVTTLIQEVREGKLELYSPPEMLADPAAGAEAKPKLEIGFLKVDRSEPKEKWLVESLLSMEPDLKDPKFADKPMVFGIFGRGRALPPFVGPGITRDNLLMCVDFVTGACSCTVKDQNPGMDLLVAKDWFAAAEKLATRFGGEEGSEHHLGAADMFPDVIIPGEQPKEPPAKETVTTPAKPEPPAAEPSPQTPAVAEAKAEPAPETVAANPPAAATVEPAAATSIAPPAAPAVESATASVSPPVAAALPAVQTAHAAAPLHAPQASEASFVGVFTVGAGLCVALVLLFGLTFLVLRPK